VRLSQTPIRIAPDMPVAPATPLPPRDGGVGRCHTDLDHLADAITRLADAIAGLRVDVEHHLERGCR
jgi:hypothetical protein